MPDTIVNDITTNIQAKPSIGSKEDGSSSVIAWQSNQDNNNDIYSSTVNSSGAISPSFRVNNEVTNEQINPDVSNEINGLFEFTWQGSASYDTTGIYIRSYSASTNSFAHPGYAMNYSPNGLQSKPRVSGDSSGATHIVWQSSTKSSNNNIYYDPGIYEGRFFSYNNTFTSGGREFKVD